LCCATNVRKKSRVGACVSIGTNIRERMSMFRISKVVVWQFMHDVSRDFELDMECVCPEKSTCCFVGAPKVFGTKWILKNSDVWIS
jgi:hypothetical protein